jgi:hypothetical protein
MSITLPGASRNAVKNLKVLGELGEFQLPVWNDYSIFYFLLLGKAHSTMLDAAI